MKTVNNWAYPDYDEFMLGEQKADGTYQGANYRAAMVFVKDRSMAVDCGAHVGTWTRLMSQDFGKVIAVEPSPDTYEALLANLATFTCTNVETRQMAVGNRNDTVGLALDARAETLKNTGARFVRGTGDIPMGMIDDWNLPSVGFIKMDIEGSEYHAIIGARATIKRCQPIILFENKKFWLRYDVAKDGPQRLLMTLGYRELGSVSCDRIWGPV
jgi:FkbM family methyltransferase